jgi:hypothetical protein
MKTLGGRLIQLGGHPTELVLRGFRSEHPRLRGVELGI